VHVAIGIANATKELDVQIEDPSALVAAYEKALADEEAMMTIEEIDSARTVVAVGAILYFKMEPIDRPGIGFFSDK